MRRTLTAALVAALVSLWAATVSAARPEVRDSVLVVPAGTTGIGPEAFADRDDFNRVVFESPCVLREIGPYAFMGCSRLRDVELPGSLRSLGEGAFRECGALVSVTFGRGLTRLPRYAFAWCASLRDVTLPSTLTDIQSHAFAYCGSLRSIHIPAKVRHIGSNVFSFCGSLEEVAVLESRSSSRMHSPNASR